MKSYNESNDEIKVEKRLKEQTKRKMLEVTKKNIYMRKFRFAVAYAVVIVAIILSIPTITFKIQQFTNKEETQTAENTASLNIHDFLISEAEYQLLVSNEKKNSTVLDKVKGEVNPMCEELLSKYQNRVQTAEKLIVPKQFTLSVNHVRQYTYEKGNIGPYALYNYEFTDSSNVFRSIIVSIEDEKMPHCMADMTYEDGVEYNGYQLFIYENIGEGTMYTVYAQKEELSYKVDTYGLTSIELNTFLESLFI